MKKILMIALFALGFSGLVVTATQAAPGCQPGCDCVSGPDGQGVLGQMKRHADSLRVRNKAYSQQIIKKNDSAIGMTCFDRALGLTSRLGQIFSDTFPEKDPKPNLSGVFGMGQSIPNFGMAPGKMLGSAIGSVIQPIIGNHVLNFGESLSSLLNPNPLNLTFLNEYARELDAGIDGILGGPMAEINGAVGEINTWYRNIKRLLDALPRVAMPTLVSVAIDAINEVWQTVKGLINGAVSGLVGVIRGLLQPIIGRIMGAFTSMLGPNPCDFLGKLWKKDPLVSIVGKGIELGIPYFNMKDLIGGNINLGGYGIDFGRAVEAGRGVLDRAWGDVMPGGPLSMPGHMPTWPAPPILPDNLSVQQIIEQM